MEVIKVEKITDIKERDLICITGGNFISEPFKVRKVQVSESDGTEVIFDMRNNKFFNVQMYLDGKSWVREVVIIR